MSPACIAVPLLKLPHLTLNAYLLPTPDKTEGEVLRYKRTPLGSLCSNPDLSNSRTREFNGYPQWFSTLPQVLGVQEGLGKRQGLQTEVPFTHPTPSYLLQLL